MAVKKSKRSPKRRSKVTARTVTFHLSPEEVKKAKACLEKSGEIRYQFREIRATKLPHLLDDGKIID